jgi:hypothetical protein
MIMRTTILILILLLVAGGRGLALGPCDDLPGTITRIGLESDPTQIIKELHSCGAKAVSLLISELHVIDPEAVNEQWLHQVWVERALRSITGQYFAFVSTERLSARLAKFREQSDKLGLVMERMSTGEILVAPRDVQTNVTEAWKTWLKRNGSSFVVQRYEPFGTWYW